MTGHPASPRELRGRPPLKLPAATRPCLPSAHGAVSSTGSAKDFNAGSASIPGCFNRRMRGHAYATPGSGGLRVAGRGLWLAPERAVRPEPTTICHDCGPKLRVITGPGSGSRSRPLPCTAPTRNCSSSLSSAAATSGPPATPRTATPKQPAAPCSTGTARHRPTWRCPRRRAVGVDRDRVGCPERTCDGRTRDDHNQPGGRVRLPFAVHWDGTAWSLLHTPNEPGQGLPAGHRRRAHYRYRSSWSGR